MIPIIFKKYLRHSKIRKSVLKQLQFFNSKVNLTNSHLLICKIMNNPNEWKQFFIKLIITNFKMSLYWSAHFSLIWISTDNTYQISIIGTFMYYFIGLIKIIIVMIEKHSTDHRLAFIINLFRKRGDWNSIYSSCETTVTLRRILFWMEKIFPFDMK